MSIRQDIYEVTALPKDEELHLFFPRGQNDQFELPDMTPRRPRGPGRHVLDFDKCSLTASRRNEPENREETSFHKIAMVNGDHSNDAIVKRLKQRQEQAKEAKQQKSSSITSSPSKSTNLSDSSDASTSVSEDAQKASLEQIYARNAAYLGLLKNNKFELNLGSSDKKGGKRRNRGHKKKHENVLIPNGFIPAVCHEEDSEVFINPLLNGLDPTKHDFTLSRKGKKMTVTAKEHLMSVEDKDFEFKR